MNLTNTLLSSGYTHRFIYTITAVRSVLITTIPTIPINTISPPLLASQLYRCHPLQRDTLHACPLDYGPTKYYVNPGRAYSSSTGDLLQTS